MEGDSYPTYPPPGQSSAAAQLPNKGKAVEEKEPDKNQGSDHEGNNDHDGDGQRSQGEPPAGAAAADTGAGAGCGSAGREQDRLMPIANVIRIMRKVLPTHVKLAEDAKLAVQHCVTEFIGHVAAEANKRCRQEQRKIVTEEDMLWALGKLGFNEYVDYLNLYMYRLRLPEAQLISRSATRDAVLPAVAASASAAVLYPAARIDMGAQAYPAPGLDMGAQQVGYSTAGSFPAAGGSSGAAIAAAADAAAGGGAATMPEDYQRNPPGTKAGSSTRGQLFGFDPYDRYS